MNPIDTVPVDDLQHVFGWTEAIEFPAKYRALLLSAWEMAADDCTLRYVFRNFRPARHLEFGTWLGDGVLRCAEECDATVWTINLPEGESRENGEWAYSTLAEGALLSGVQAADTLVTSVGTWVRTDAHGLIGRKYLRAGLGNRVCQIYSDSRTWDTRNYPVGFFDSAFIDGGHAYDIVANDTRQAINLVRPGGLVVWHDYCPLGEVNSVCRSTRDVVAFIAAHGEELAVSFEKLFWVHPSWLLFGIRRG
ncbi:MAG: class I SAM-dependent methyltransferase [Acidobacteriota bacterium]